VLFASQIKASNVLFERLANPPAALGSFLSLQLHLFQSSANLSEPARPGWPFLNLL
jgi:hypothetical protein